MNNVAMHELNAILKRCTSTMVGGYAIRRLRAPNIDWRGKIESNDVDIVVMHPNADQVKGQFERSEYSEYTR